MKTLSPSALKDLANAKAIFQARTLEMILTEKPASRPDSCITKTTGNTPVTKPVTPERTP